MRRYGVDWADCAAWDLRDIASWIAVDSPARARAVLRRLDKKAGTLRTAPLRGRVVPELRQFGIYSLRELVVRPYRIVYRVADRRVLVLGVFDGRRDLRDVLLERLTRG